MWLFTKADLNILRGLGKVTFNSPLLNLNGTISKKFKLPNVYFCTVFDIAPHLKLSNSGVQYNDNLITISIGLCLKMFFKATIANNIDNKITQWKSNLGCPRRVRTEQVSYVYKLKVSSDNHPRPRPSDLS